MTAYDLAFNACEVSTKTLEKLIQDYARIQIEKDRESVKLAVEDCDMYIDEIGLSRIYKETPIRLD